MVTEINPLIQIRGFLFTLGHYRQVARNFNNREFIHLKKPLKVLFEIATECFTILFLF